MSVSLYSGKIARNLLFLQLMVIVLISAAFCFKSLEWGRSALAGGIALVLPNAIFMLLTLGYHKQTSEVSRIAWSFVVCEGIKVIITIVLLVVMLSVFHAVFVPLGLAYLAVLVVQIVAPAVINSYRN